MKILHINTATTGGAATAALRIHQGMVNQGLDSHFMTLSHASVFIPNHHVYSGSVKKTKPDYPILTIKNWVKEKIYRIYQKKLNEYKNKQEIANKFKAPTQTEKGNSFELFSFSDSLYDITETEIYKNADIIHLHWVSNFLDYSTFFKKNTKPVIWTIHDENPFLGGFHYEGDLIRNKITHWSINEEIRSNKEELIQNAICIIKIVSPSFWLAEKARKSNVFKDLEVITIRNGIDLSIFKKRDKNFSRELLNLPYGKRIFLIASADLKNYRKGIDIILPIIQSEKFKNDLFLLVGANFESYKLSNVISLGSIQDQVMMSIIYSAVDTFILPSREYNLPNTMLESIACGTPIIAFNIGDNEEVIGKNNCGLICDELTTDSLLNAIKSDLNEEVKFDSNLISEVAQALFSEEKVVQEYKTVYERILQ